MSKKDTLTKQFLGQDEVFADAFNYYLFHGKQVIRPEDLKAQDPTEIAVIRKQGQLFPHQRFRDVLKHCTIRCTTLPLLFCSESKRNHSFTMLCPFVIICMMH